MNEIFCQCVSPRYVDGQAAYGAYPNFSSLCKRAEDLMSDLMGEEPCLFYVRRKGAGRLPGEEIWDLTIGDCGLPQFIHPASW